MLKALFPCKKPVGSVFTRDALVEHVIPQNQLEPLRDPRRKLFSALTQGGQEVLRKQFVHTLCTLRILHKDNLPDIATHGGDLGDVRWIPVVLTGALQEIAVAHKAVQVGIGQ